VLDRIARSIAISAILALPAAAEVLTIYRCTSAGGSVSLQDKPCHAADEQTRRQVLRHLDTPSLAPAEPERPQEGVPSPALDAAADRPPPPPPPLWVCVDFDGSQRESSDGQPRGRYVPLWVVGRDPDAPAQLFGRVGDSPGLPAVAPAAGARSRVVTGNQAAPQVWVAERCYELGPAAACRRYAEQQRELERRIFNAQPSERALLAPQSEALRRTLTESCP